MTIVTWKSVDEELPDAGNIVMIYMPSSAEPIWLGSFDGERWTLCDSWQAPRVSHWAELPAPPGRDFSDVLSTVQGPT